ncbi:PREDICTED: uncharacterized protein LOC106149467 isoform X2 [Chinchilla lanigera]|uniref:uncharacterized protein LOC106149467 isoform X2 n=1 Tax=Chinchilla lanigera TaxID=34839 RepID=UPI000697B45C|nr:PREDICTED: uncharacterized protein LOC106149467 isoform X2 [Chinchilla lanigera]
MFCIDTISFSNISSASVAESMHVEPVGTEGVTGRSHEGLPWERWKVICPAVNHRSAFRYQQAAPHWACSDVSDVADKQQPAGTRLKIVVLPPPRAASGICQTDDKVPWTESHQTAFGAECTAKLS